VYIAAILKNSKFRMLKDKNTKYTINTSVSQNAIESTDEMINILPLVDFLSII
jgi:hypothetical protein